MMTSSGSGPYTVGGSWTLSSSSNLSPLAPPFRVDKSLHKQNSTNTSVNYPDVHMYAPYVDPNGQLWNSSSSTTGQKFEATESMGFNNTCSSSPANYGYSVSQPSTTAANVYHVASGTAAAYDPFLYDSFPTSVPAAVEEGVKSYYSQYVSAPPPKDGYLSLDVSNGHGYDLLPNSSSAHLSNGESSASDYLQNRPGDGDLNLNWGSFWSGVNKQDKWQHAQGFGSKDSNLSDLVSSKSPFVFDRSNKSQSSTDVHARPFVDGSSDTKLPDGGTRSNLKQDGCFDIFGGAYHLGSLGIDQQDSRSLISPRIPVSIPASIPQENPHFQTPVMDSVSNLCGTQKQNGPSPGDHFSQSGFYVFGCPSTSSTFPITKNKSAYGERSSSVEGTVSAVNLNSEVGDAGNGNNISLCYDYSRPIEPQISVGSKRQSSVVIRRPLSSVMPSPSQIGQSLITRVGSKDGSEQVSPQKLHQFSSDCLDLKVNDAQAPFSADKISGGSEVHNPAEDSPCWRGASSNRFSPFVVSEGMCPDVCVKKLDECKSLSTQDPQTKSFRVDTCDLFSEKIKEGNSLGSPFIPECVLKHDEERCSAIRQPLCFDLNTEDGLQFADDCNVSTKECCILNKPKTDLHPGIALAAIHTSEGGEALSPREISEAADSGGSGLCPLVAPNKSLDGPSSSENKHASSAPADNASLKQCQMTSRILDSDIDVNMLLKTMTNLSEILRCYCFSKQASVPHQHSFAIKHIIANLNASMLMMAGEKSSTMELPIPQMVNKAADEALTAAVKLGGTAEGLFDAASCKDDPNTVGDVIMVEALKKILQENLHEEEMDQQKLLYKSLWLDAEASLCAMTAKARFLRVKAEMERTHDVAEDSELSSCLNTSGGVCGPMNPTTCKDSPVLTDCQKYYESNDLSEIPEMKKSEFPKVAVTVNSVDNKSPKTTNEEFGFLTSNASRQGQVANDSNNLGSTCHAYDEGSVMARYQILKSRAESSEVHLESKELSGGLKDASSLYVSPFDSCGAGTTNGSMGADDPVSARYQILKCRADLDSLSNGCNSPPGEHNYLPDRDCSSPVYQILECGANNSDSLHEGKDLQNSQELSNSVGVPDEDLEASVMGRFRIIQNRVNHSEAVDKDEVLLSPEKAVGDVIDELGISEQQSNVLRSAFGPYPNFTDNENVDQLGVHLLRDVCLTQYCKTNRLKSEIIESWYDNDCSSSDWEHVSKEDVRRPN